MAAGGPAELDAAISALNNGTGLGLDHIRPQHLKLLPRPTVAHVRAAAGTFPNNTSTSADGWEPWVVAYISNDFISSFIDVGLAMEVLGCLPEQPRSIALGVLPKPQGGYRTIGVFGMFHRLWARVRRPAVRALEAANPGT